MPTTHTTGMYIFSLQRQDSTVALKNFVTLYNPVGSGKNIEIGRVGVSFMATVAAPAYPMRGYRVTAQPTGGTLATGADICAFDTKVFTPAMEIRYNNPTVTGVDGAIFSVPPGTVKDTISEVSLLDPPIGFNPFLVRPGEGVVLRQDVGAVGHFWNLSLVWRELRG